MYKIILASGSPRRKELFEQIGVEFSVCSSDKEEITTKSLPGEIVAELAAMKAQDVAGQAQGNAIIIGADTMVALDNHIMGKPKDKEDCIRMLQTLQGRKHQVYTGVSIIIRNQNENATLQEKIINFTEATDVWVKSMSEEQINDYAATGEPYDKAGAYAIQGIFAVHIDKIEGDYNNIVGFPISKLYSVLIKEGINILKP